MFHQIQKINANYWQLTNKYAESNLAILSKNSIIWNWCLILHWQKLTSKQTVIQLIFCDALPKNEFHLLKILVRITK